MKKILIFAGLAVLLVGLPLYSKLNKGSSADEVEISAAERRSIKSSTLASGTIAYRQEVLLGSEIIAKVTEVHVEEADFVRKGDPLISLETKNFEAQVEQARARMRMQQIAIERQEQYIENMERRHRNANELAARELIDEDSFENLDSELDIARIDLRSQQESLAQARAALIQSEDLLSKTQIMTPIDGMVIQVDVKVGETVIAGTTNLPGSTLMIIADPSETLVEVRVDEADIASIAEGQSADIYAAAWPNDPLTGVVESIATTARQNAGQRSLTFLVKILLDEQDEFQIRSGMSARAEIFTQTGDNALAVPIEAIRFDTDSEGEDENAEDQLYVFVMEDGKAVRRDITAGMPGDSHQEVLTGVTEGDLIITGPFRTLKYLEDGDEVEEMDESDSDEDEEDE